MYGCIGNSYEVLFNYDLEGRTCIITFNYRDSFEYRLSASYQFFFVVVEVNTE